MFHEKSKLWLNTKANVIRIWEECCIFRSNAALCDGVCSSQIFEVDKALICDFCDALFCIKYCRHSDKVNTMFANSEVAYGIIVYAMVVTEHSLGKGMPKFIKFIELKLNEYDDRLSNISKIVDYLVQVGNHFRRSCQNQINL